MEKDQSSAAPFGFHCPCIPAREIPIPPHGSSQQSSAGRCMTVVCPKWLRALHSCSGTADGAAVKNPHHDTPELLS